MRKFKERAMQPKAYYVTMQLIYKPTPAQASLVISRKILYAALRT